MTFNSAVAKSKTAVKDVQKQAVLKQRKQRDDTNITKKTPKAKSTDAAIRSTLNKFLPSYK